MIRLGLTGYPLSHSLSPQIHEAALKSAGLEGRYSLFPIAPGDKQGLKDLLARVQNGEMTGLNVTIPHKQNVTSLLGELTPTAESIGAVNTIYRRDHRLTGDNTDAPGFLSDLNSFLTPETRQHGDPNALILGAGGSARAVVYALLYDDWRLTVAARRPEQAEQLAASFMKHRLQTTGFEFSRIDFSNIDLIVNTTPIGMTPNPDQSPWPENLPLPPHATVYDLVYNPAETKIVRDARHQGLRAITGLGMLIEQAALSFKIWTGQTPSRERMRASVEQHPISSYPSPLTNQGAS